MIYAIRRKAEAIGLEIKHDYQLFSLSVRDVRAVGYRFYGNGRISFRKRNWLKIRRQFIRMAIRQKTRKEIPKKSARGFLSRFGNIKHISTIRIRARYISQIDFMSVRRAVA